MPQIMCPNCGTTINLENRKETDFDLIRTATKKEPRTFTELLRVTNLSRKTLSLRLKELCQDGTLVKEDGVYNLNGGFSSGSSGRNRGAGFSRIVHDKRIRTGLVLVAFLLCFSASSYVLAMYFAPRAATYQEPVVLGNFTVAVDISNMENLYSWQVAVRFNSSEMKVLQITPGGFVGSDFPFFVNCTDSQADGNVLLLGGTLFGNVPGKSGSGTLATVVFGYFVNNYTAPEIAFNGDTFLSDPDGSTIPIKDTTLTLSTIGR
jgi:DNA-binding Lrp family transcriptional regulator